MILNLRVKLKLVTTGQTTIRDFTGDVAWVPSVNSTLNFGQHQGRPITLMVREVTHLVVAGATRVVAEQEFSTLADGQLFSTALTARTQALGLTVVP